MSIGEMSIDLTSIVRDLQAEAETPIQYQQTLTQLPGVTRKIDPRSDEVNSDRRLTKPRGTTRLVVPWA